MKLGIGKFVYNTTVAKFIRVLCLIFVTARYFLVNCIKFFNHRSGWWDLSFIITGKKNILYVRVRASVCMYIYIYIYIVRFHDPPRFYYYLESYYFTSLSLYMTIHIHIYEYFPFKF